MPRYSRAGKHYASFAKCFNCLVAFIVMAIMGFVSIPPLLILNEGHTTEDPGLTVHYGRQVLDRAVPRDKKTNMNLAGISAFFCASGVTPPAVLRAGPKEANGDPTLKTLAVSNPGAETGSLSFASFPCPSDKRVVLHTLKRGPLRPLKK